MKRKTSKPLALNKETLRVLEDVSKESLEKVAGGSTGSYCCSTGDATVGCCF